MRVAICAVAFLLVLGAENEISAEAEDVCLTSVSEYASRLDALFEKNSATSEKLSVTPYKNLNDQFFPLAGCELVSVEKGIRKSRFLHAQGSTSPNHHVFVLSDGKIEVGFSYLEAKKKSEQHWARFTEK